VRGPKLNTVLQVRLHQCWVQEDDHLPTPAGHTVPNTNQDAVGLLGHLGTPLAHVQPAVSQHPKVLFRRAAFQPLLPKPAALHGVVVTPVEEPALGLVEPHTAGLSRSIQPVQTPLQSPPALRQMDTATQLGATCRLTEGSTPHHFSLSLSSTRPCCGPGATLSLTAQGHAEALAAHPGPVPHALPPPESPRSSRTDPNRGPHPPTRGHGRASKELSSPPRPSPGPGGPEACRPFPSRSPPSLTSTVFTGAAACSGVRAPSSVASASIASPPEEPRRSPTKRDPRCGSQTRPPAAPAPRPKVPGPRDPGGGEYR